MLAKLKDTDLWRTAHEKMKVAVKPEVEPVYHSRECVRKSEHQVVEKFSWEVFTSKHHHRCLGSRRPKGRLLKKLLEVKDVILFEEAVRDGGFHPYALAGRFPTLDKIIFQELDASEPSITQAVHDLYKKNQRNLNDWARSERAEQFLHLASSASLGSKRMRAVVYSVHRTDLAPVSVAELERAQPLLDISKEAALSSQELRELIKLHTTRVRPEGSMLVRPSIVSGGAVSAAELVNSAFMLYPHKNGVMELPAAFEPLLDISTAFGSDYSILTADDTPQVVETACVLLNDDSSLKIEDALQTARNLEST